MISRMMRGAAMRATPPSLRMSDGTRSSAITAQAPASSAIFACSALVTSIITPPFSISARPTFTRHRLLLLFVRSIFFLLRVVPNCACSKSSIDSARRRDTSRCRIDSTNRPRPRASTVARARCEFRRRDTDCALAFRLRIPPPQFPASTGTGRRYSTVKLGGHRAQRRETGSPSPSLRPAAWR